MRKLLSIALIFTSILLQAQVAPNKYYVQFTDKNNSPYSIDNPSEYLSQRAIDRRVRQGIPIDMYDIPVNPQYLQGVAATGAVLLNPTKWFNGVTVMVTDPSVIDQINALPYVFGVTKATGTGFGDEELSYPEKPFFKHEDYRQGAPLSKPMNRSNSAFNYGGGFNQIHMLNGDSLHNMGFRGEGMVIAVLDAGFLNLNTHPNFDSLWANDQILGTRDFVKGGEVTFDEHTHGTMVTSTIGGNAPGELIGTAPKASFFLLRSEDGGSENIIEEYNWVSAAEYADSVGADIINSSLGYTTFDDPTMNHTYEDLDGNTAPVTRGADRAASRGMIVCNSAGNEGSSTWYYHSFPADGDSVVAVGAVDADGNYVSFSGHGPTADGRIKPDVAAQGSGTWVADPWSNSYTWAGGTSFSSPITAGMMACLWQANPDMTNMEIIDAARQSASQYLNPDDELGYGIPDYALANSILTVIENHELNDLSVILYPNPATDYLYFVNQSGRPSESIVVELMDVSGKIVMQPTKITAEAGIDISSLSKGVYLARVILEKNKSELHKLVIK